MDPAELPAASAPPRPANLPRKGRFAKGERAAMKLTVATRRQTPTESRRYTLAIDSLLAAVVRAELGQVGSSKS